MTEHESAPEDRTENVFAGVAQNVVQARDIHGGLHFHHSEARPLPVPSQLPTDVAHFTGRGVEIDELDTAISDQDTAVSSPVVISAIVGTAGVGKTALAVHWAHRVRDRFPDGQLYVNLRGYDPGPPVEPAEALDEFLRALDVPAAKIPAGLDARATLYRSLLTGKRLLIVLDNAAKPEQVRPVVTRCTGLRGSGDQP